MEELPLRHVSYGLQPPIVASSACRVCVVAVVLRSRLSSSLTIICTTQTKSFTHASTIWLQAQSQESQSANYSKQWCESRARLSREMDGEKQIPKKMAVRRAHQPERDGEAFAGYMPCSTRRASDMYPAMRNSSCSSHTSCTPPSASSAPLPGAGLDAPSRTRHASLRSIEPVSGRAADDDLPRTWFWGSN